MVGNSDGGKGNWMKKNTTSHLGQLKSFSMYGCIAQKKKGLKKPEAWNTSSGLSPFFRGQFFVASKMALKSNIPQGLLCLLPREKLSFCYVYQRGVKICQQKRHQVLPMKTGSSRVCVECIATTGSRRALVGLASSWMSFGFQEIWLVSHHLFCQKSFKIINAQQWFQVKPHQGTSQPKAVELQVTGVFFVAWKNFKLMNSLACRRCFWRSWATIRKSSWIKRVSFRTL